jgi:DNA polymerase III delta prime subunit
MLADKYRPGTWSEVVGNDRAIEKIADLTVNASETGDPLVLLLTGPAGVGKSTVARLVAKQLGAHDCCTEHVPAGKCTAERVREVEDTLAHTVLFGSGWKVVIVEEVDKIVAPQAINLWLTLLETMPKRCAVIFTSNPKPDELFGGIDSPFVSRSYPVWFSTQGLATRDGQPGPGAQRLKWIAQQEGVNGKPDSYYVDLLSKCKGNIRAAIHKMELEA